MSSKQNAAIKLKKDRAWELDVIRGISILLVALDHFFFDAAIMFGSTLLSTGNPALISLVEVSNSYMSSSVREIFRPIFLFLFFFVSGICTTFSRNNFKRGIKLALVALALSLFTFALEKITASEEFLIVFGVLHCLAASILIYAVISFIVKKLNKKNNKFVLPITLIGVTIVLFILNSIFNIPFNKSEVAIMPSYDNVFLGIFIFTQEFSEITNDYFPLLPYIAFFLAGAAVSPVLYPNKKSLLKKLDGKWHYIFSVPGRYSLLIYILSQVIAIGTLALICFIETGSVGVI